MRRSRPSQVPPDTALAPGAVSSPRLVGRFRVRAISLQLNPTSTLDGPAPGARKRAFTPTCMPDPESICRVPAVSAFESDLRLLCAGEGPLRLGRARITELASAYQRIGRPAGAWSLFDMNLTRIAEHAGHDFRSPTNPGPRSTLLRSRRCGSRAARRPCHHWGEPTSSRSTIIIVRMAHGALWPEQAPRATELIRRLHDASRPAAPAILAKEMVSGEPLRAWPSRCAGAWDGVPLWRHFELLAARSQRLSAPSTTKPGLQHARRWQCAWASRPTSFSPPARDPAVPAQGRPLPANIDPSNPQDVGVGGDDPNERSSISRFRAPLGQAGRLRFAGARWAAHRSLPPAKLAAQRSPVGSASCGRRRPPCSGAVRIRPSGLRLPLTRCPLLGADRPTRIR